MRVLVGDAARFILALGATFALTACAVRPPGSPAAPHGFDQPLTLNGATVTLHFAPGLGLRRTTLLVYATGDGGWRGKDRQVFTQIESWGYAAVGFSAPQYLGHLPGQDGTATPALIARDFGRIIDAARRQFQMNARTPAVLVGVSRGADLAVVAAGQRSLQDELGGVVAVGLTREEEYVRRRRATTALELYPYLHRLGDLPVSVIQSTRDNYLPADAARALFGDDSARRQLHPIEARNHSFAGAREQMYATLRRSLEWVDSVERSGGGQ